MDDKKKKEPGLLDRMKTVLFEDEPEKTEPPSEAEKVQPVKRTVAYTNQSENQYSASFLEALSTSGNNGFAQFSQMLKQLESVIADQNVRFQTAIIAMTTTGINKEQIAGSISSALQSLEKEKDIAFLDIQERTAREVDALVADAQGMIGQANQLEEQLINAKKLIEETNKTIAANRTNLQGLKTSAQNAYEKLKSDIEAISVKLKG